MTYGGNPARVAWGLFSLAAVAMAGGGAPKLLDQLISASDDIVVGRISSGSAAGVSVNLSIEIERVLKGQLAAGGIVAVSAAISEPAPFHQAARDRGIFFRLPRQRAASPRRSHHRLPVR